MTTAPRGNDALKALAKELGVSANVLLAMSKANDPFYCGQPRQAAAARWLTRAWGRFGGGAGFHLRRFHYRLISQKKPPKGPDGRPYLNTDESYEAMGHASRWARHLGLLDPLLLVDRRNPEPMIFADESLPLDYSDEPGVDVDDLPEWLLPKIPTAFEPVSLDLPDVRVRGYDYCQADQPYHLELWIEKSTMNDVLVPVCERLHVNFVPGVGFQSITGIVNLLRRLRHMPRDKPCLVWYGSDFDPAGDAMPVAVARLVEYYMPQIAPGVSVKLMPLFLTKEQVVRYDLPRTPIKESDLRKNAFEDRRGKGAVELDALEALHPGELTRIVEEAIEPYRDDGLQDRLSEAEDDAGDAAQRTLDESLEEQREELDRIEGEANEIAARYEGRLRQLDAEMQAELAPLREQLEAIRGCGYRSGCVPGGGPAGAPRGRGRRGPRRRRVDV
jgi:hypothetical protein